MNDMVCFSFLLIFQGKEARLCILTRDDTNIIVASICTQEKCPEYWPKDSLEQTGKKLQDSIMLRVYTGQVLALVEIMKNVLKMHGIESCIRNQYLSAAVGEIPPHESWPQLWVSDQDFECARKVIAEAERDPPESQEILICPRCGEEVEGQFAECWNCGADLD